MDYIEKIKQLRLKSGMTQVELSIKLGLSQAAYGLYETRQRQMSIDTFRDICILFHVSSDELLDLNK